MVNFAERERDIDRVRQTRAESAVDHADAHPLHALQGNAGNAAVTELIRSGQPTPLPFRAEFERSFGVDFSDVKVRVGASEELVRIGAKAVTHDDTVVFADRNPDRRTVAHELAHVVQNRRAGDVARDGVGDADAASEHDADRAADAAVAGQSAEVTAKPSATVQRSLLDVLRRNLGGRKQGPQSLSDEDVLKDAEGKPQVEGLGGSANRVYKTQYGGFGTGFFKPNTLPEGVAPHEYSRADKQMASMSGRAVASSRLAQAMGMGDLIAEETYASHNGQTGSTSKEVTGAQPLKRDVFEREISADEAGSLSDAEKKQKGDKWFAKTGANQAAVDYRSPDVQRGMFDLQAFDAVVGQSDRHGGNIYVGDGGKVTGIDNDRILSAGEDVWGMNKEEKPWQNLDKYMPSIGATSTTISSRYQGLPSMVDEDTAGKISKFDFSRKNLRRLLDNPDLPQEHRLTDEDYKALKLRGRAMQKHIKGLKKTGGIIGKGQWGTDTYAKARGEIEDKGEGNAAVTRNYLVANERAQAKQRWGGLSPSQGPQPEGVSGRTNLLGAHRDEFRQQKTRERAQRRKGIDLTKLWDEQRRMRMQRRKGLAFG